MKPITSGIKVQNYFEMMNKKERFLYRLFWIHAKGYPVISKIIGKIFLWLNEKGPVKQ